MSIRLTKLKLAGFKSFVDLTQISLPSNLIGVVGPNGCGKSNIIDAIRWVMGESSARLLRGESMADVISNGSATRKPVGQASVELVFDNSDGSMGGEYAQYNEIGIKRIVSRDGASNYYLNGARCRRKDITDIFLGTGLGPRSYSIIEQGMISRIIEAKPEELRVFIEEAAGISKYKERRKETENRIQHTRENLERLTDIRQELAKQLERLDRQAQAAERYKVLLTEQRQYQAQLLALRWQAVNDLLQQQELQIKEQQTAYESHVAEIRHYETKIVSARETHSELQESFNTSQENYYRIGSDIARLEESIQYQHQRKEQLKEELKQIEADLLEVLEHEGHDKNEMERLKQQCDEITPQIEQQQQDLSREIDQLTLHEQGMLEWQQEWDEFNRVAAESSQQAHVQQTNIQHLEHRLDSMKQRVARLQQEKSQIIYQPLVDELQITENEHKVLLEKLEHIQQQLTNSQQSIVTLREKISQETHRLGNERSELQRLQGRLSSLEALQQAALGKQKKSVAGWLEQQGLSQNLRLAQIIEVEAPWEKAVEVILAERLQAILLEDFTAIVNNLDHLENCSISFINPKTVNAGNANKSWVSLKDKVKTSSEVVNALLTSIYPVETLEEGLQRASQLQAHECVVTRDGICIGNGWLSIKDDKEGVIGVIHREQEIKQLTAEIESQQQRVLEANNQLTSYQENLTRAEEEHRELQHNVTQTNTLCADNAASQQVKKARIDQLQQRSTQLTTELTELQQNLEQANEELVVARSNWQTAMLAMEQDAESRQQRLLNKEQLTLSVSTAKEKVKHQRELLHQQQLTIEAYKAQQTSLEANLQRLTDRISQLQDRKSQLVQMIETHGTPEVDLKRQLEEKLSQHLDAENNFKQARHHLELNETSLHEMEDQKHDFEQLAASMQQQLETLRMDRQTYRVQCEHFSEQVQQTDFELNGLLEAMPAEASVSSWEQQINSIATRIDRLGAINLAAIDEFKIESERKGYLDSQHEDLAQALETLENAIRKIDQETRTRFKETFESVNNNFKTLFPRLFGGGNAQLMLLDDDLLNTGITVIAKPPGKQNSRIQMLSGGEKAMTAVALVFAIFQLNPSPFCMLDEVDAPLDDVNVGRYCSLVKEMSDKVQFVFITHNKVTMELADHLMGVTMHEPGVSRIVSVDVEAAVSLAEA